MLEVKRAKLLGHQYEVTKDGQQLPELVLKRGRIEAEFSLDGTGYRVRRHRFSGVYELLAENDEVLASTDRVRRQWSLHAAGGDIQFRAASLTGREYSMLAPGGGTAGTIRREGMAGAGATADLPGLATEIQVFAVAAVLLSWRRKRTAAAARGAASG
ncbi:hypothetical protein [Amycolatopsis saalfeldensis]|uniref:Tubby C 2 n=1 Tax=Amycolatopsis saalfeldensis TaxID=394193 RepID=A0A1H8YKL3_9PSEU|nr:hypothetical protein [Amycolatopsis saalfeldensis]SEP52582.1 hypothetical protein SAMN04489732_12153 [Amycolatopsis saalfeldensis]